MIQFEGLGKDYGDFVAVRELSLEVKPKEIYALLGATWRPARCAPGCRIGVPAPVMRQAHERRSCSLPVSRC